MSDKILHQPDRSAAAPTRRRGGAGGVVLVLLLVAALAGLGVLGWWANGRWGRHAMVVTGIAVVEALIGGDADGLAAVSDEKMRAQLDPSTRALMRNSGILVDFTETIWNGDTATIQTEGGMGSGTLVAGPATDGKNVVTYRTMGAIGFTDGAVSLSRTMQGWVVTGITVNASELPTASAPASGSVEPTAAP